jgi:hypothetical protein
MKNDLRELSAFAIVAEERSFTRAAARLGVSQSALSHSMRGLEKGLGLQLGLRRCNRQPRLQAPDRFQGQTANCGSGPEPDHPKNPTPPTVPYSSGPRFAPGRENPAASPRSPDTNRCPPANFFPQCADRSRKPASTTRH